MNKKRDTETPSSTATPTNTTTTAPTPRPLDPWKFPTVKATIGVCPPPPNFPLSSHPH